MKYTGSYSKRTQVQRSVAYKRLIKTAKSIKNYVILNKLLDFCVTLQHIDSDKATGVEMLIEDIYSWAAFSQDTKELGLMRDMVRRIALMEVRKRVRQEAVQ